MYDECIDDNDIYVVDEVETASESGEMEVATDVDCCETRDDNLGRHVREKCMVIMLGSYGW